MPAVPLLRRRAIAVLVGALALLTSSAPAATASAHPAADKPLVTFGIGPASATRPDPRPYLSYGLGRGGSVLDHVAVFNQSNQPLDLLLYAGDGFNPTTGGLSIRKRDDRNRDVGAWVTLGPETATTRPAPSGRSQLTVRVPPQSSRTGVGIAIVPVRITVPSDAEPGDHVGGISAALVSLGTSRTAQNLELEQRVVTRLYLDVAGERRPGLKVSVLRTSYDGGSGLGLSGTVHVRYRVTNSGNVRVGAGTRVRVAGPFGLGEHATDGPRLDELVPGSSVDLDVDLRGVAPTVLAWAKVTVEAFRPVGGAGLTPTSATARARVWVVTWQELVLLVLVLGAGAAAVWSRRRRADEPRPPTGRHARRRGQTAQGLVGAR